MPCIRVNPVEVVENLIANGIIKRKAGGRVVPNKWELSFPR